MKNVLIGAAFVAALAFAGYTIGSHEAEMKPWRVEPIIAPVAQAVPTPSMGTPARDENENPPRDDDAILDFLTALAQWIVSLFE